MNPTILEIKVPSVGESVTEVEIANWLKQAGDAVARDENLLVLETDKATLDVPSPVAGRLVRIRKQKGERVQIGEVLAEIEPLDLTATAATAPTPAPAPTPIPASKAEPVVPPVVAAPVPTPKPAALTPEPKPAAIPTPPVAAPPPSPPSPGPSPKRTPPSAVAADRLEEVVPMTLLRRKIGERLVAAQHTAALLTTFNEIDLTAVQALRQENQERFLAKYQIKLGLMSFFIKATVAALQLVPQLNAEIRGSDIVYHNYHALAIAMGGGRGLVAPVLRDAGRRSFAELERDLADYALRVKENRIAPDDLHGGTFTITNGGVYGSLLSTPLVNLPQCGILGLHAIQDRPVALAGQVVIRPMMYVALSYDHRLVDGREAVQFLKRIKELIESPARLLLEI